MARSFRPAHSDDLGLRRALSDRLLPLLVAAMVFLAGLALAGAVAAAGLAAHWRLGAASLVTVQVPDDGSQGNRAEAVAAALRKAPGVGSVKPLSQSDVSALLAPWLGTDAGALALHLPSVFEVRLQQGANADGVASAVHAVAPDAPVEQSGAWLQRLAALANSLQACAALALCVVAFVAAAVTAIATRAGIAARRDSIETVHALGATDGFIAARFAFRVTWLVFAGALIGLLFAVPVVAGLARMATPFVSVAASAPPSLPSLPPELWAGLALLPAAFALVGWVSAQITVRGWLARLP
jgi:cell division transport system permease protein